VSGLLDDLRAAVGPGHVLVDADLRAGYEVDWTGRFRGTAAAVVRPGSSAEVAAAVRACGRHGAAVVPQGGNTGLVGGGVPLAGEVVLSLRRLDALAPVEPLAGAVTVGAGATLAAVQAHVAGHGLDVGVDLAARDTATIGGMAATNAGGLAFVRHGAMRARVAGLEAVLADGGVVTRLSGLDKDNTGYDLSGLLCGSEGTLGVITAVRLRLVRRVDERVTALVGFPDVGAAVDAVAELRRAGVVLEAAELMFGDGLVLVGDHLGIAPPVLAPAVLLLEWADERSTAAVAALAGTTDVAVAEDPSPRAGLWRHREAHTEAVGALGIAHKLDVTVPLPAVPEFVADVRAATSALAPGSTCVLFGHAADGNLHVNVVGPPAEDETVDDAVLRLAAGRGGSISAEHGIGTAKKRWLPLNRSPTELAVMRAVKAAFDPAGVLNPNVLLP
jgi:FAD/FMN-containing dehydrogenase